jgi:orotate phosphoribosyltransferase
MPSELSELIHGFIVTGAFRYSDEPKFPLSSGRLSKYYVDCKLVLSDPRYRLLAGELVAEKLGNRTVDAVGGLVFGAMPVATSVSDAVYRKLNKKLPALAIRRDKKEHGLKKVIEGKFSTGQHVLIVDDVVTSGGSTIEAIEKAESEGLIVVAAISVVDREEGGREAIEGRGIPFDALLTLGDLLGALQASQESTQAHEPQASYAHH